MLKILYKKLYKIIDLIYPSVFIFEGLEKNSGFPLSFAYVGSNILQNKDYWIQISLSEGYKKQDMGRHFIWNILSFLKEPSLKCDFLVVDEQILTERYFCLISGFTIPYKVNMELDISFPVEKLFGSQRHGFERRIRKNKLNYMLAKDNNSFDDFYYHLYLPYSQTRFSSTAILLSYQQLRDVFSKGGLILIKKEEEVVAGQLYDFVNNIVRLHSIGVREGRAEHIQDGVLGACYYFSAIEMKKKGYVKLLIGYSRPFFNDGAFKYKVSLNACMARENKTSCLWFGLLRNSIGLKHFLINNPFVFLDEKESFYRAIFGEIKEGKLLQESEEMVKSSCDGLDGTFFYAFGECKDQDKNFLKEYPFIVRDIEDVLVK